MLLAPLVGLSLLQAQLIPAQATKPPTTQRNPFEPVPEPREPAPVKLAGPTIDAIEFRGARRLPQHTLRALILSRVGSPGDIETLRRDSQNLYKTGRFSDIILETEPGPTGVIVRFVLIERPLIQTLEYQGDNTVTIPDIMERFQQRNIKLRAETLYHKDELGLAAATIQELVAERGRQHITVTPLAEPTSPSSVKITFKVEEKQ